MITVHEDWKAAAAVSPALHTHTAPGGQQTAGQETLTHREKTEAYF